MQYLREACKGKVAKIIAEVPIAAGNFKIAWDTLVERFENEHLLVYRLIERLIELPIMTKECPIQLARLIDGTNQYLRALKVLGRTVDEWSDWLVVQTTRKLDFATRMSWEKALGAKIQMPTFNDLDKHLKGLLRSLQTMNKTRQTKYQEV